ARRALLPPVSLVPETHGELHPPTRDELLVAAAESEGAMLRDSLKGCDPYDALNSPIFKLPPLRRARLLRRVAQQALRRLPVNPRPALGIRKHLNPVTA